MKKTKLSVIIIAKNEEKMIGDCLKSVRWADEIILVDSGSTDDTLKIAKEYGAKIIKIKSKELEFSKWRNAGLKKARGDWILYVDADERVTPELRREVLKVINNERVSGKDTSEVSADFTSEVKCSAYVIPRRNFYLGREMHFGGAWPDYVKRLFLKKKLKRWEGKLHENPIFSFRGRSASGGEGKIGRLKNPLIHITHRDLSSMVEKTRQWSKIEAELLYKANHPPVTWWRILRIMLTEFWQRGIKKQGWRDGTKGWIEIIFQMFSRFITYARLWERQQKDENRHF